MPVTKVDSCTEVITAEVESSSIAVQFVRGSWRSVVVAQSGASGSMRFQSPGSLGLWSRNQRRVFVGQTHWTHRRRGRHLIFKGGFVVVKWEMMGHPALSKCYYIAPLASGADSAKKKKHAHQTMPNVRRGRQLRYGSA